MPISTYPATSKRHRRGYVVVIDNLRVRDRLLRGEGFTRDAAIRDAKKQLADYLGVHAHQLTLVVSGDQ